MQALQQAPVIADAAERREALQENTTQQDFGIVSNPLIMDAPVARECANQPLSLRLQRVDHLVPDRYGDVTSLEHKGDERLIASLPERNFQRVEIAVVTALDRNVPWQDRPA